MVSDRSYSQAIDRPFHSSRECGARSHLFPTIQRTLGRTINKMNGIVLARRIGSGAKQDEQLGKSIQIFGKSSWMTYYKHVNIKDCENVMTNGLFICTFIKAIINLFSGRLPMFRSQLITTNRSVSQAPQSNQHSKFQVTPGTYLTVLSHKVLSDMKPMTSVVVNS